jgi:hypothetical protein
MSVYKKIDLFEGDDSPGQLETTPATYRQAVIDICAWNRKVKNIPQDDLDWLRVEKTQSQFAELYRWLWVEKDGTSVEYKNAPNSKDEANNRSLVNMFDYVMLTQTYGFDLAQQEAVVNAYYSDFKAAYDGKPLNPADATQCAFWRPMRSGPMDNSAQEKTNCQSKGRVSIWYGKGY